MGDGRLGGNALKRFLLGGCMARDLTLLPNHAPRDSYLLALPERDGERPWERGRLVPYI